jgi:GDPmannose 4,6-dehydratase
MVGSHLAEYLLNNTDLEIHGITRWRSPLDNLSELCEHINSESRVFLHYADLEDEKSIDTVVHLVKPVFVFHLAAQSYPQTSFTSPIHTLNVNILGTARLLESIRTHTPDAIVHVCSSSEVFGRVPKESIPIKENCAFHPASPYAISKVGTDLLGQFYAEAYGLNTQITRMFTHTGPRRGDVFAESSFAKQIAMIEAGIIKPVIFCGNLESLRTVADVRDAVHAYYLLLTKNPIPGSVYNIGGKCVKTIGEILGDLVDRTLFKGRIEIRTDPKRLRPIDADLQVPDCSQFVKHTGWTPKYQYTETLDDLLEYWRRYVSQGRALIQR